MPLPTLIANPPQLSSASSALSSASPSLSTELPKFSVADADPLSAAISMGAGQVEMPMLALPGIKTKATPMARNTQNALPATGAAALAVGAGAAGHAAACAAPAAAAATGPIQAVDFQ